MVMGKFYFMKSNDPYLEISILVVVIFQLSHQARFLFYPFEYLFSNVEYFINKFIRRVAFNSMHHNEIKIKHPCSPFFEF